MPDEEISEPFNGSEAQATARALYWGRGRPARNEREARKWSGGQPFEIIRDWWSRFAGGTPAVPVKSWGGGYLGYADRAMSI
jgi:hypothetical protein